MPAWDGAILFVEDVGEDLYRIDRMFTQLKLVGALDKIRGFVFGTCSECGPGEGFASLTLEEILIDHIKPLGVPAWFGAMIGHQTPQWTLPVGANVEIDAGKGTITMLDAGCPVAAVAASETLLEELRADGRRPPVDSSSRPGTPRPWRVASSARDAGRRCLPGNQRGGTGDRRARARSTDARSSLSAPVHRSKGTSMRSMVACRSTCHG